MSLSRVLVFYIFFIIWLNLYELIFFLFDKSKYIFDFKKIPGSGLGLIKSLNPNPKHVSDLGLFPKWARFKFWSFARLHTRLVLIGRQWAWASTGNVAIPRLVGSLLILKHHSPISWVLRAGYILWVHNNCNQNTLIL